MSHSNAMSCRRTRTAALRSVAAAFLCLLAASAFAAELQEAWHPPLKYPEKHFDALHPVIEYHDVETASQFFLRPIYSRRNDKFNQVVEWDFAWPIVFGTSRPDLRRLVIFPLFVKDTLDTPGTGKVSRTVLLPLYFRKSTERDGVKQPGTFFVFPFGGVIRNFLGRDRILVVLWPIFVKQEKETATSYSVIHPIFTWVRWKDGSRGFKFWPIYGRNSVPGKFSNQFILWPFHVSQWDRSEMGETRRWWLWPFYGKMDGPGGWMWTVAWPFVSGRYEKNANETMYWYPWPFLGHRFGPERGGRTFWPIYRSTISPNRRHVSFLWPFGWYRRERPGNANNFSLQIIPLMFFQRERSLRAERDAEKNIPVTRMDESGGWQAWPLMRKRWNADGSGDFEMLSLFPMRNYGPWERNFAPFFRVFHYVRANDGGKSWRFLWRIVRVDRGAQESYTAVKPLFSVRSSEGEEPLHKWNVLGGLVGRERNADGVRWRVLYLLKWRTQGR